MLVTPKFCISIVFSFSCELKKAQEKLKTIIVQNLRALWYVMVFSGVVSYQWARFCNGVPFEIFVGSKHFYGHGSKFYDHLETLLLNLHNVLLTKKLNLFFKQFGSQPTLIFRCKSKQDNNN